MNIQDRYKLLIDKINYIYQHTSDSEIITFLHKYLVYLEMMVNLCKVYMQITEEMNYLELNEYNMIKNLCNHTFDKIIYQIYPKIVHNSLIEELIFLKQNFEYNFDFLDNIYSMLLEVKYQPLKYDIKLININIKYMKELISKIKTFN